MTGRQVAGMIFYHLKISDADETVLDLSDPLKVEPRGDNVQSFDTRGTER